MTSQAAVDAFLAQPALAVVGMSRSGRGFGNYAVAGECILMFAKSEGFHKVHRWVWKLAGKLPA